MRRDLPDHIPVVGPAHAVVHRQLNQRDEARDARHPHRRRLPLDPAERPEQDNVHEAHRDLVEVLYLVAYDFEVL